MPVLGVVGVRSDGGKHLLALELCGGESAAAWKGCLDDLVARGLRAPVLCIIDGNPGLRRAVGEVWPRAAVQRCCVHELRNFERKAPKHALAEIRDDFHRIVYATNADGARATNCSRSSPSPRRNRRRCAPRTRSSGSTRSFAGA